MKRIGFSLLAVATLAGVFAFRAHASGDAGEAASPIASPIYGVTIPAGYRDWKLIAVDQLLLAGKSDQLRAQLGNDIAIKAYREGKIPFPDGAIIAAIHWTRVPSEGNNKVLNGPFPGTQSFVIGSGLNVQFMVKDSKKYAATGGWGFADFKDGKPGDKALHETCFPCHTPAKDRDYVFTHYAPLYAGIP
ncbi:MAG: cytochrome P460 family protein [Candidatus Binataceae bacterium]|jgi:hypothetical protein